MPPLWQYCEVPLLYFSFFWLPLMVATLFLPSSSHDSMRRSSCVPVSVTLHSHQVIGSAAAGGDGGGGYCGAEAEADLGCQQESFPLGSVT